MNQNEPAAALSHPKKDVPPEELFRENLQDVISIVERLAPLCKDPDDLVNMMKLALINDGQLRMLFREMSPLSRR